ncbi:nucleotide sugar dehydrogenase [Halobacillus massiliensis]|uniref:nucleotide sugar dehydrogenase n=1 Tax=Halobacillus massiliensis TaxID=1926286 RepID=UPI0009E5332B|nr:nucleotide sugar dehydrogenase [Halobacillus massiliensis]
MTSIKEESWEGSAPSLTIGLVGLGYVGLPVAVSFAEKYKVIGYDVNQKRVDQLSRHQDITGEVTREQLKKSSIHFTTEEEYLNTCGFIIVAVPTPISDDLEPDLTAIKKASAVIGRNLSKGTIVVYESTVYPGTTEDVCIPILQQNSQLKAGSDFFVGYSPERINPGDKIHTFKTINKVVASQDKVSLEKITHVYQSILEAEVYQAPSIKVAEASKVVENTQRDINIAYMNELSHIFHYMNIDTYQVLEAANTKWNFLPFIPGLVGGHCIGVDPYYLIHQSKKFGYEPSFLISARKLNDSMPAFITQSLIQRIIKEKMNVSNLKVAVMGVTFKENIPDLRNSKALKIVELLKDYNIDVTVCDPAASEEELAALGITAVSMADLQPSDIVILAVSHDVFRHLSKQQLKKLMKSEASVLVDLKGVLNGDILDTFNVWRL